MPVADESWLTGSFLTERPSENRIKEAAGLYVSHFVVSCPKDMTMYSDAVKTTGCADPLDGPGHHPAGRAAGAAAGKPQPHQAGVPV